MLKKVVRYVLIFCKLPRERKFLLLKGIAYSLQAEYHIRKGEKTMQEDYPQRETKLQSEEQRQRITMVAQVVQIIGRRMPWKPMCLNLSLVAKRLLQEQAIETTLHIGFKPRRTKKEFAGHAWLTIDGQLITGWLPDLANYRELVLKENR